jgi:hypothetical protein
MCAPADIDGMGRLTVSSKGALACNAPLYLKRVADRRTLGCVKPLCSMGRHYNLQDRTRTLARVKAFNYIWLKSGIRIRQG